MAPDQVEHIIQSAFHITVDDLIAQSRVNALGELLGKIPVGRFSDVALKTAGSKRKLVGGDSDEAHRLAREASEAVDDTTSRVDLRTLASHLMRLEHHKEALPLWERICSPGEYSSDVRHLIRCAERVDRQDVVLKAARAVRESGIDDPWLMHRELDILQENDVDQAISVLQGYLARNPDDQESRLRLSMIGLQCERPELVDSRPEAIPEVATVTPTSGSMAADVLRKTGRPLESVRYAYELYRRFNDDPIANMALVAALFGIDSPPPDILQPEIVGTGCAVRYQEAGGPEAWVIVEDSPAPNRALGEFPPSDPVAVELSGKRIGDTFTLGPSPVRPRTGIVVEVVSKYVYRTRHIVENWQVRFPDRPWLNVFRTRRSDPETGEDEFDLTDMKLLADRNFERARNAERDYKARKTTLHIFAHDAGLKDFEASLRVAAAPGVEVHCWVGPPQEWAQAITSLADSEEVVVELSALATLFLLPDEQLLRDWQGRLVVSHNTMNQLRECLPSSRGFERVVGRFGKSEKGYHFIDRDPGEEERHRERLAAFIALVAEKVEVRGCEAMVYLDPEKRQIFSDVFGQHGLESMLLSSQPGRVLWSDDATLTANARSEFGARCAWTQVAVEHGLSLGFFGDECARSVGAKLLGLCYRNTRFNERVVWEAAKIAEWDPDRWPFAQALEQLSNPTIVDGDAATLALAIISRLYDEVAFPPSRQRVVVKIAERLGARADGLTIVMALAEVLPRRFGFYVLLSDEATGVLKAWIAEASRRIEIGLKNLLMLPYRAPRGTDPLQPYATNLSSIPESR